ncbi:uncharacterized protein LOC125762189 [Anopheles funestus]|uniref:uncharacterized protein LOC125762189 n=1 Tax=Anopheles funestus TaxID=62324 RepID=UPI0020C6DF4A|nr:uncharacterized protein LOC125762189 [Anopheles funestus]
MIAEPVGNNTKNRILFAKMEYVALSSLDAPFRFVYLFCNYCSQHLYLPINHTHHSETFFIDIFSRDLRYAILGFVLLIVLLNVILTRKNAPIRHLFFVYELLSGTRAYPHPKEYIPNRAMQLVVGIVLQIISCALATFLVAQLSVPVMMLPVKSLKDLAQHPEYKVCIPMLRNVARHIPALARGHNPKQRFDRKCHELARMGDPEKLADYLCDRENDVVILSSDAVMNMIFHDEKLLERMCDIVPIERKIFVTWLSLPHKPQFKHAEFLKQFIHQLRSTGLLLKPYLRLTGSWSRYNRHKKNRWADIELSSLQVLFLGYGAIGCCSLVMLVVELLVAQISKIYKRFRK